MSARQSVSTETSARMKTARAPCAVISEATASPFASSRPETTTRAPSSANDRTMPSPIPAPEPVTTATLSFKRLIPSPLVEMLSDLCAQKTDRFTQLFHTVLAVFNRNPAVEPFFSQGREDRVVIVQSFTDHAVLQVFRVTHRAVLILQILYRPADQVAVRSMHRDDAALGCGQHYNTVFAADDRVRRVEIHSEPLRVNFTDDFEEDVQALREFGVFPVAVLVMILHVQNDAAFCGMGNHLFYAFDRIAHAVFARHVFAPLARQHTAISPAESRREVNPKFLFLDLLRARRRVALRKIGRAAHHRDFEPFRFSMALQFRHIFRLEAGEEARIHFNAVHAERRGKVNPIEERHRARDAEVVHITFRESA